MQVLSKFISKKFISFIVTMFIVPFLAMKGIDLGIPPEKLTEIIYAIVTLAGSYFLGQGIADGWSGGVTSATTKQ